MDVNENNINMLYKVNTAYGFYGTASRKWKGGAMTRIWNGAVQYIMSLGFREKEAVKFLNSQAGRHYGDALLSSPGMKDANATNAMGQQAVPHFAAALGVAGGFSDFGKPATPERLRAYVKKWSSYDDEFDEAVEHDHGHDLVEGKHFYSGGQIKVAVGPDGEKQLGDALDKMDYLDWAMTSDDTMTIWFNVGWEDRLKKLLVGQPRSVVGAYSVRRGRIAMQEAIEPKTIVEDGLPPDDAIRNWAINQQATFIETMGSAAGLKKLNEMAWAKYEDKE